MERQIIEIRKRIYISLCIYAISVIVESKYKDYRCIVSELSSSLCRALTKLRHLVFTCHHLSVTKKLTIKYLSALVCELNSRSRSLPTA